MANKEVVDYIKKEIPEFGEQKVRESLQKAGWQQKEIDDAFAEASVSSPDSPLEQKNTNPNPSPEIKIETEEKKPEPEVEVSVEEVNKEGKNEEVIEKDGQINRAAMLSNDFEIEGGFDQGNLQSDSPAQSTVVENNASANFVQQEKPVQETKAEFVANKENSSGMSMAKIIVLVVLLFVLLGVGAVAGYFVYSYFTDNNNGEEILGSGGSSEEEVLEKNLINSLETYLNANSLSSVSNLEFSLDDHLKFRLNMNSDFSSGEHIDQMLLRLGIDIDAVYTEYGEDTEFSFVGQTRLVDGVFYFILEKFPEQDFFDVSPLLNKWLYINLSEYAEQLDVVDWFLKDDLVEVINKHGINLLKLAQESGFLSISIQDLGDRASQDFYRYQININLQEQSRFLREMANKYVIGEQARNLRELANEIDSSWAEFAEVIDFENYTIPVLIDIDKSNLRPKRISVELDFTVSGYELEFIFDQFTIPGSLFYSFDFRDIDKPVNVEHPEHSEPLESILDTIMENIMF